MAGWCPRGVFQQSGKGLCLGAARNLWIREWHHVAVVVHKPRGGCGVLGVGEAKGRFFRCTTSSGKLTKSIQSQERFPLSTINKRRRQGALSEKKKRTSLSGLAHGDETLEVFHGARHQSRSFTRLKIKLREVRRLKSAVFWCGLPTELAQEHGLNGQCSSLGLGGRSKTREYEYNEGSARPCVLPPTSA